MQLLPVCVGLADEEGCGELTSFHRGQELPRIVAVGVGYVLLLLIFVHFIFFAQFFDGEGGQPP